MASLCLLAITHDVSASRKRPHRLFSSGLECQQCVMAAAVATASTAMGGNDSCVGSGECVRLKNLVVKSEITGNVIQHCGVYDFVFDFDRFHNRADDNNRDVVGEGIYIGTSFETVCRYIPRSHRGGLWGGGGKSCRKPFPRERHCWYTELPVVFASL